MLIQGGVFESDWYTRRSFKLVEKVYTLFRVLTNAPFALNSNQDMRAPHPIASRMNRAYSAASPPQG